MNHTIFLFVVLCLCFLGCKSETSKEVVVYVALDREFSEPILQMFQKKTSIKVLPKYDSENTKSVGLTACIIEEKNRPRCDVFWNNEIINTLRLKNRNLLDSYDSPVAMNIPATYRDKEKYWVGFAARARVLIVNKEKVKKEEYPNSIWDLTNPKWKGKFGIAKPVAGTTATHIACLFAHLGTEKGQDFLNKIKQNQASLESGNKQCAQKVANGELYMALTDTDDAMVEIREGKPVGIIYLDSSAGEMGTLFIPNTLALIKNSPHPEEGKQLIDFLLSPEVEDILAKGPSAQIPLNKNTKSKARVKTPQEIQDMDVDLEKAASLWEETRNYVTKYFLP